MDGMLRRKVEANLFRFAHPVVEPWDEFPWHPSANRCDTWKRHSSQALAIDVFGTVKTAPQAERDVIVSAIAHRLGIPSAGPWDVQLEWTDHENMLKETKHLTQVDARLVSPASLICVECKFAERTFSPCSQPEPLQRGRHKGVRQCNGNYEMQVNPVNGKEARCSLAAKHIQYWSHIPWVFRMEEDRDYRPCPFAGDAYQWMRNVVAAYCIAANEGKKPHVILAYADHPSLTPAQTVKSKPWNDFIELLKPDVVPVSAMSYQSIITDALQALQGGGHSASVWLELQDWVSGKIQEAGDGKGDADGP